jgi:hypothetical protein
MSAKESAVAKSRGSQDERDMSPPDAALLEVLYNKKKLQKMKLIMRKMKNLVINHVLNASLTLVMKASVM